MPNDLTHESGDDGYSRFDREKDREALLKALNPELTEEQRRNVGSGADEKPKSTHKPGEMSRRLDGLG